MNLEKNWTFLAYFISVTILGLLGNTFGFVMTCRKKLKTIGPVHIFSCLFIFNSTSLIIHLEYFLFKISLFDIKLTSKLACKLYFYASFLSNSIVTMMLVYITLERFLSMKYPVESNLLRQRAIQLGFIFVSIGMSAIVYFPNYIHHDIVTIQRNDTHYNVYNKTLCTFASPNSKPIILFLAFLNRVFLSIILILAFSLVLIFKIKSVKNRVYLFYTQREIVLFKRDLKLSLLSIVLNSLSISLTLPIILVVFVFKYSNEKYFYACNLFYLSHALNFYLYLGAYLIFKEKKHTKKKSQKTTNTNFNCESLL